MLTRLTISNLATIESLSLDFSGRFTVLTGETGAGKSILIDAIRFVLGEKAAPHQVRSGAERTLVEAVFDLKAQPEVCRLLSELEVPFDGELTLRRMLGENGRSRAVANDCAITQGRLEELGDYLVNIHGQHDNQLLLNSASHLEFLDAFGGLLALRAEVSEIHGAYTGLLARRKSDRAKTDERRRRREELTGMVAEMRAVNPLPGEEEALKGEHALLANAEQLQGMLSQACEALYEGEAPVLERLGQISESLGQAAHLDPRLRPLAEQMGPVRFQLEDLHRTLSSHMAGLEADPNRLEGINARLAELEKIKRRHDNDLEGALGKLEAWERELDEMDAEEEGLEKLEQEIVQVAGGLHALSGKLSRRRAKAGGELNAQVMQQMKELGMEKAVFETHIEPLRNTEQKAPSYSPSGMDQVEFMLSANPGQKPRPLSRIASGGELSRTMLALKSVLAQADPTKTLVFDEVDSGISGKMAEIVGYKLRGLGSSHQVLCVTHLPQIAALGHRHVLVSKSSNGGQTFTRAEALEGRDKVEEVARLLSGINISSHSLASAEEMVARGGNSGT